MPESRPQQPPVDSERAAAARPARPRKLWLVRHARPLIGAGICYGRTDMAADPAASAQCAQQLAGLLPAHTQVFSSPLKRCAQLSESLRRLRPDLTFASDARLQEMDFGQWEGQPWQAIDAGELRAWTDAFASYRAGHSGESVGAFMGRVTAAFDALAPAANHTLWITHAGVIRAVALLAQGLRNVSHASQWPIDAPEYGQWRTLDLKMV